MFRSRRPLRRPAPLGLLALDDRIVPARAVDVIPPTLEADGFNTFYALSEAVVSAGDGGTVTVRAGAIPETATLTTPNVVIQGDTNLPPQALPAYTIVLNADGVKLRNLNLPAVTLSAGTFGTEITRSVVGSMNATESSIAGNPNGGKYFAFNTFTGQARSRGNTDNTATNDVFEYNTFVTSQPLDVSTQNGITIRGNTFTVATPSAISISAVSLSSVTNFTITNNTIRVQPGSIGIVWGISVASPITGPVPPPVVGTITANRIDTGDFGTGVRLVVGSVGDANFRVAVAGNDFHRNAVGVSYSGAGGALLASTLGGPAQTGSLTSLGGNNFRGFTDAGTSTRAAVGVAGVASGARLSAAGNIFDPGLTPASYTFSAANNVFASALSTNQALVMNLFLDALGRPATSADISAWLNQSTNQEFLANGIGRSNEAVGVYVDGLYRQYLKRNPDAPGRAAFVGNINNGLQSTDTVRAIILSSAEYVASNPTDVVQSYYVNLLTRSASVPEIQSWYQQLPALTLFGVANGFVKSAEFRSKFLLNELFRPLLHRVPSGGDYAALAGSPLDLFDLRVLVYSAPEYRNLR